VRAGDIVIIDLTDPHQSLEPLRVHHLLGRATLCLLPGEAPINPQWLDLAAQPDVHVLAPTSRKTGDTVTEVFRLLKGPSGSKVAELVLRAEPALRPVQDLVEAVCLDPWSVRRPRDLAVRCRKTLATIRRQCTDLGFTRIEHLIICVRLLAQTELVATERLPLSTARTLAGISDPSNMRRHAQRAAQRSPMVERALQSAGKRR
jgi:hypothetical protein